MNKYTTKGQVWNVDTQLGDKQKLDSLIGNLVYQQKINVPQIMPGSYTPKNGKEIRGFRSSNILRHSSQEQFREIRGEASNNQKDNAHSSKLEQEFYNQKNIGCPIKSKYGQPGQNKLLSPKGIGLEIKNSKSRGRKNQVAEMYKISEKIKPTIKKPIQPIQINRNYLKQTSSTSSTDSNLLANNKIPSFFKTKLFKNQKNGEYLSKENFQVIRKFGQGKFGNVFLVKQIKTGYLLAMKIIQKKKIIQSNLLDQFIRQLKIQAYLNHPNIIKLYGFFHDQQYFYILMELGCDGQLYKLISDNRYLSQQGASFIINALLKAIKYMHQKKILHRDIKPQNIVLIHGNVKICDFGWAVHKKQQLRSTYCGTPLYFSPQLLSGNKYDEKVDIWAVGVLTYELHLSKSPFNIQDQSQLHKIITSEIEYPQNVQISPDFKQFVQSILKKNPKQRFDTQQLLNLNFIRKYNELQTCQELCN